MKIWGIILALVSMTLSGLLLWFSLKEIPIGTAYAIWTSIGAVGTFTIGVLVKCSNIQYLVKYYHYFTFGFFAVSLKLLPKY